MNFAYAPYLLKRLNTPPREGALIRIKTSNGKIGYADCHPWPELGDFPLPMQLKKLSKGEFTSLTERTFYFAQLDAEARANNRSLFEDCKIPESHVLVTHMNQMEPYFEEGFRVFKIKAPLKWNTLKPYLEKAFILRVKLRLDCNGRSLREDAIDFVRQIGVYAEVIDFIEDPISPIEELPGNFPCPIANDRLKYPQSGVTIHKPAVELPPAEETQRLVVTSYLDHPFGQLCAAFCSANIAKKEVCGLLSHRVYETTGYSEQLTQKGPHFTIPKGTGFGFNALLCKEQWTEL